MTYIKVDVMKPSTLGAGAGGDKKDIVTIVDARDILTYAPRDASGVVIAGSHVFKPGAYSVKLEVTSDSIAGKPSSEGDADAKGIMQEIAFAHPGNSVEIREFRSNWLNRPALVFVHRCKANVTDQYGSQCAPVYLDFEGQDDKDAIKTVFTFKSIQKGPDVADYRGTLTYAEPVALVVANATNINLVAGPGQYQLTQNSSATVISTASNAVDGMVFTLLGSGGTNPATINASGEFMPKNGTTWTGLLGAQITFKAFKTGTSTFKYIEVSRA